MSTTKYDHLPEQEKHAALAREEAAIKAEALRYHDKHRMTPAKVAKLTARHVVLALLAAFWLIPILWLVVTSFGVDKGPNLSTFFPKAYTLDHYKALLSPDSVNQFPQWMLNTFIVACFTCVISTLFVLMVAYAMSCMRFKARKPLMNIAIILNLFPGFLSMIAVYFIMKQFGLTGTLTGLIIVYSAGSGMGYLIAKGFFDTVSKSLRESAYLEGANEFTVFWKIILPLSKPIIVYTVINSFLAPWMDFVFADLMMTSGTAANKTVALGLVHDGEQGEPQQLLRAVLRRRRDCLHSDFHSLRHHAEVLRRRHHGRFGEGVTRGSAFGLRKGVPPLTLSRD